MPRNLTKEERVRILMLHKQGKSIMEISKTLYVARATVRRWVNRNLGEGSLEDRPRKKAPRILTRERVAHIINVFRENPLKKTSEFANEFDCTTQTIRVALHRAGMHYRQPRRKNIACEKVKLARLRFAREFRDFDFSHAIFSGEPTFVSIQQGTEIFWRVNDTMYKPYIKTNNKPGINIVNMWGWMSADGPGELVHIDRNINRQSHSGSLQDVMLPCVRLPREEMPEILFFQNSASIHRPRIVQDWLVQNPEIRTVCWPSQSPDLNPLKSLWEIMSELSLRKPQLRKSKYAFVDHCCKVWDALRGTDFCEDLVRSMRERCDAVIEAGGGAPFDSNLDQ